MKAREHWLDVVVGVLRANTADLRELATLAGADPKTFYVGANLDGVDMRGQDLRGMRFTGLRAAKVLRDAETQLDPDADLEQESMPESPTAPSMDGALGLVYVPRESELRFLPAQPEADGIVVFGPNDREQFSGAAAQFAGPSFVLLDLDSQERLLTPDGVHFGLAVGSSGEPFDGRRPPRVAREHRGPVILLQQGASTPFRRVSSAEIRDAVQVMGMAQAARGHEVHSTVRMSNFVRATGVGADRVVDALCQLYGRLSRLNYPFEIGKLFLLSRHQDERARAFQRALFPAFEVVDLSYRAKGWRRLPDAAALVEVDPAFFFDISFPEPESVATEHVRAVKAAFELNGWRVFEDVRRGEPDLDEVFRVESDTGEHYRVRAVTFPMSSSMSKFSPEMVDRFNVSNVREIIVTEHYSYSGIAWNLIYADAMVVTMRDIAGFFSRSGSIWSLVMSQLPRLSRAMNSRGLSEYLSLLLGIAAESLPPESIVVRDLQSPRLLSLFDVRLTGVKSYAGVVYGSMHLYPRGYGSSHRPIVLQLAISSAGPTIIAETELDFGSATLA